MGLFSKKLPKRIIVTLPAGYSEEKAINEINRDILFMVGQSKEKKDKLLYSITSSEVLNFSIRYSQTLISEFKKRHKNDLMIIGDERWKTIEATFFEGIYVCTLIFYNNKHIRDETIQVPTGKKYEDFFNNEIKEFDKSSDYADNLIPPYLFKVFKNVSLMVFNEIAKDEQFIKTSEEFRGAILMQYLHLSAAVLGAYLIQDSFLTL